MNLAKQLRSLTNPNYAASGRQWLPLSEGRMDGVASAADFVRHQGRLPKSSPLAALADGERYCVGIRGPSGDPVPLTAEGLCELSASMIAYHLVHTTGIRIINVSEAECDLYASTDLSKVDVSDWHQCYPVVLVKLTDNVFDRLLAFVSFPALLQPVNIISWNGNYIDHLFANSNLETAFTSPLDGSPCGISPTAARIATNAVLHATNYPDLYGGYKSLGDRVVVKMPDKKWLPPKRVELVPQLINLRTPYEALTDQSSALVDVASDGPGHHRSPHWRRGHWRTVRTGAGRGGRKDVFIKHVLVNGHLLGGAAAPALTVMS